MARSTEIGSMETQLNSSRPRTVVGVIKLFMQLLQLHNINWWTRNNQEQEQPVTEFMSSSSSRGSRTDASGWPAPPPEDKLNSINVFIRCEILSAQIDSAYLKNGIESHWEMAVPLHLNNGIPLLFNYQYEHCGPVNSAECTRSEIIPPISLLDDEEEEAGSSIMWKCLIFFLPGVQFHKSITYIITNLWCARE